MIFPLWLALICLGVLVGLVALNDRSKPIPSLVAAVIWTVVSFGSANIEFLVTYAASDYLKDFSYSYLVILFGLFGLGFLVNSVVSGYGVAASEVDWR